MINLIYKLISYLLTDSLIACLIGLAVLEIILIIGQKLYNHRFNNPLTNFLICLNCGKIIKINPEIKSQLPLIENIRSIDRWDFYLKPCCNLPSRVLLELFNDPLSLYVLKSKEMDKWPLERRERAIKRAKRNKYDIHYKHLLDYKKIVAVGL